jgi:hypothetical protein
VKVSKLRKNVKSVKCVIENAVVELWFEEEMWRGSLDWLEESIFIFHPLRIHTH